jgi:hypothetical protein
VTLSKTFEKDFLGFQNNNKLFDLDEIIANLKNYIQIINDSFDDSKDNKRYNFSLLKEQN